MAKVLCLGDSCADLIIPYKDLLNGVNTSDHFECGGANANSANALGKLNVDVSFAGKAGNDIYGIQMKNQLKENNVDVSNFVLDDKMTSTLILVGIDENNDRHPFLLTKDNPSYLQIYKEDLNKINLSDTKYILTNGMMLFENPAAENITEFLINAHEKGIKILLDINYRVETIDQNKQYLNKVVEISDYLLGSIDDDFLPLTNSTSIEEAVIKLKEKVIVARNSKGSTIYVEDNSFFTPSFKVSVVDTLGAGDSFNAGFIYGLVNNESLEKCNLFGCAVAAICISGKGARNTPNTEELSRFIKQF